MKVINTLFLFFALAITFSAQAQVAEKKTLTLEGAKRIAAAAEAKAAAEKLSVVIAVLDDAGNLIYLQRMDKAPVASLEIALGKARTAAGFKLPSAAFEGWLKEGGTRLLSLPNTILIEGGVPVEVDGEIVGAVGVSGASSQQDAMLAKTGIEAMLKSIRQ